MNKFTYRKMVIKKTKTKYFAVLKKNAIKARNFKLGMKKLLKSRAHNIMRVAYVKGLKQNWHRFVIE